MSTDSVTLLLAVLAVMSALSALAIGVAAMLAQRDPASLQRWGRARVAQSRTTLLAAGLVALTMMAGSLYLSEVANFPPCRLCWYQRIAAYPLGPILLLAWFRGDRSIRPYGLLLAAAGMVIAAYHVLLERIPSLETGACEISNPCTIRWVERLGFMTIPTMSLIGFTTIAALLLLCPREVPS